MTCRDARRLLVSALRLPLDIATALRADYSLPQNPSEMVTVTSSHRGWGGSPLPCGGRGL